MGFLIIKKHQTSHLITINTRNYGNTNKQHSLTVIIFNTHRTLKMLSLILLNGNIRERS